MISLELHDFPHKANNEIEGFFDDEINEGLLFYDLA